jgi:hypothetical protein
VPYTSKDPGLIKTFFHKRDDIKERVEKAQAEGKDVHVVCSAFKDPGPDWTKLVVDGETVAFQDGY